MNRISIYAFAILCAARASLAQVSTTAPEKWITSTVVICGSGISQLELSHNSPEMIRREVLDPNLVNLIGKSGGLSDDELKTVQIVRATGNDWVELNQIGKSKKAVNVLSDRLGVYIEARREGHTKSFLLAAITNRIEPLSIPDTDLRVLVLNEPLLPASWLKKSDSGTSTNKARQIVSISSVKSIVNGKPQTVSTTNLTVADEVCRWVSYIATDGDITWEYVLRFKSNGKLDYIYESKYDAKEYDPLYSATIKEVDKEVEAEMKKSGSIGKRGSVHSFWQRKREKLRIKGIEWRSPAQLNPNTIYD